jgi:hypothetical protein
VSTRVDLQRLATFSSTSIEVHEISDSLIHAVRWRVDASRCMQRDNRRGRSNKVTCRKHPNLPMWRRKLQSGGHQGGADPRLPSIGRYMTTRIPRPWGYEGISLMTRTYKTHCNLNTLTALPPITSSLPFSSEPNTPLTAFSFVLTESHSVSPSSSGGKNG